jgi:transposase
LPLDVGHLLLHTKCMDAVSETKPTELRVLRAAALLKAKGSKIREIVADKYLVPSQNNASGGYVVDTAAKTCSCPDFETRQTPCKHVWAVLLFRQETGTPDGHGAVMSNDTTIKPEMNKTASAVETESTTKEAATEPEKRKTYPQPWARYNAAQMEEKTTFELLLKDLLRCVSEPEKPKTGRPPMPLKAVLFGAGMKTYIGMSGRRATPDIKSCKDRDLVGKAAHYNTIFKYMEKPELTQILVDLVEKSALPLRAFERQFAIDSTGLATSKYARWYDHKYGEEKRTQQYLKVHAIIGTVTNAIVAVEVTAGSVNDSPMLPGLIAKAAARFQVDELSGDKGYLSRANLNAIVAVGAEPYVAFKENSKGDSSGDSAEAWDRMWHMFNVRRDEFLKHYHRRSNVESTFSALKRLVGTSIRAKTEAAQRNEVLMMCLVYNLTRVVHAIHELGIDPSFDPPTMPECA